MSELLPIEIDLDVYKKIEMARRDFSETQNAVLRRLLGLDEGKQEVDERPTGPAGASWHGKGVTLLHGTELRMHYNGREHIAHIRDGKWLVEGELYSSPSAAASAVAVTKSGGRTNLDGWMYWKAVRATDEAAIPLHLVRQKKERMF